MKPKVSSFKKKSTKLTNLSLWTKKERRLKLLKLEMKVGTLLPILQKFFLNYEHTMHNCMPTNWITYIKWTNS